MKLLSIVIPMYNEEKVADTCYERVKSVVSGITTMEHEIIFINDGSKDNTFQALISIAEKDRRVKVINFSRNFGHQIAITAGTDLSSGDAVIVMDADMQDPPELIPRFLEKWTEGFRVVYAKRTRRKGESGFKLLTASLFYRILKKLTDIQIPLDTGDFRLMDRKVVDELKKLRETNRFVRGLVSWIGFRQTFVEYERDVRYAGVTKYPLRKMIRFALDGITSFSDRPLKIALNFGFLSLCIGLLLIIYAIVSKVYYPETTISGWTSLLIIVVFFGGVQLLTIGIVGEYVGRIYDQSKKRPLYIIEEIVNG